MTISRTPKLAAAAAVCALVAVPAALAGATHQAPTSHRLKHNALTTGAWTAMIDESRVGPPFTRIMDWHDAVARLQKGP